MLKKWQTISLLVSSTLLTGCLQPIKTPKQHLYALNPSNATKHSKPAATKAHQKHNQHFRDQTLLVMPTQAASSLQTDQIAYSVQPYHIDYYQHNRWIAPPAEQLNNLIIQRLNQAQIFQSVVSTPFTGDTDLRLDTRLLQLRQVFNHDKSKSHVKLVLAAQLSNAHTGKVIKARQFSVSLPAAPNPRGGVVAVNKGIDKILSQLITLIG